MNGLAKFDIPACGMCGSSDTKQYLSLFFEECGEFKLVRCQSCSFIYNSPRLTDEAISALYGPEYYVFHEDAETCAFRMLEVYKRTVAVVCQIGIPGRIVLDIGSAKGYHLALLKALGWHPVGIEISRGAAAFATQIWDVPVYCGRVEDYSEELSGKFHLVLASDVIEHVTDPRQFISSAARVLADGGYLVIDTPNGNSQNLEMQGANWMGLNPFHIHFLSEQHFNTLAQTNGLEVVRIFSYGNKEQSINDRLQEIRRSRWKSQLLSGLGLYSVARRLKHGHLQKILMRMKR